IQTLIFTTTILTLFNPIRGSEIITDLRGIASFSELMKLLDNMGAGIDLNHPSAGLILSDLVSNSVITETEKNQLLDLRKTKTSIAIQNFNREVDHLDVGIALNILGGI